MINKIIAGDCLEKMKLIEKCSVDLIYLDPPFFTKKEHTLSNSERTKVFSFEDFWESDTGYAKFLKTRIEAMKDLLKEDGSIFVHCDKSAEHIIRAILDNVFGAENFQSEIIWSYKRWSNSKKGLLASHQNIYFYSKSKSFKFNTIYTAYSETTNVDQILQRRTRDKHNKSVYDKNDAGEVKYSGQKKGVPLNDVWDIPYLNPKAKERVGYPTQKPLILLERIIKLTTNEEDLVLDPFCGSGTTCVAAKLLNRNFIGIDQSIEAVQLSERRISNPVKTESNLLKKGRRSYVNKDKEALSLLSGLEYNAVQRNKGVDAILVNSYKDSPVLVRVQKPNERLRDAVSLLAKAMKSKKSKKSILIQTNHDELPKEETVLEGMVIFKSLSIQIASSLESEKDLSVTSQIALS